jgi:hypothetical protein
LSVDPPVATATGGSTDKVEQLPTHAASNNPIAKSCNKCQKIAQVASSGCNYSTDRYALYPQNKVEINWPIYVLIQLTVQQRNHLDLQYNFLYFVMNLTTIIKQRKIQSKQ